MFKRFTRSQKGFTLIELLVVIAIIGVLASIVLASLNTARRKGRDARRVSDIKQLQLAQELYFDANLGNDGTGANTGASYVDDIYGANRLSPTYIASLPTDPNGGNYAYADLVSVSSIAACAAAGPCLYYHIGANLEEDGTGGAGTGGNAALAGDRDLDTNAVGGFGGLTTGCSGANGANDGCYDVTP